MKEQPRIYTDEHGFDLYQGTILRLRSGQAFSRAEQDTNKEQDFSSCWADQRLDAQQKDRGHSPFLPVFNASPSLRQEAGERVGHPAISPSNTS